MSTRLDLVPELRDAWQSAREAWPGIELPEDAFAAHVRARLPDPPTAEALGALDVIDLYLTCACLADVANARDLFARTLLAKAAMYVRRLDGSPGFADEVRQRLAEKLLVGEGGGKRLAEYGGRGPLAAWLRVAAVRVGLDLKAGDSPARAQTLDEAVAALPVDDPELDYLRERYVPAYRDAIRAALAALTSQQRNVLRLHLVSRVTTERIGALYQVNQSTIVRWLATARGDIRAHAERALAAALGASPDEIASLTRLVLSRLDLSIVGLLGDDA